MNARPINSGPLSGYTVVDLSGVGPGARCARMLADLGAAVTRVVPPPRPGSHRLDAPYHAYGGGRGWRRVSLDLKSAKGRELFLRLCGTADVVVEGFRPGVAARLGVGYDDIARVNPAAVYCSISGYGQTGTSAGWVGHDLNYDALAGMLACTDSRADGAPAMPGLTVADSAGGGMQAVISILAALLGRTATGRGRFLDVSMTEGVLYLMSMHVDEYLATGQEPVAGSSILTGGFACYELYQTADHRWVALGAIEGGFFANVCRALGCEQWIPHQFNRGQQDAIRQSFRDAFALRSRAEWLEILGSQDSCFAPVNSIAEVAENPHFLSRGVFIEVEHPEHGRFRQIGPILAGMERPNGVVPLPSAASTDTRAVLAAIGIEEQLYEELAGAGIVA